MTSEPLGIRANLEVADLASALDFYRRTLGLEPVTTLGDPPTFALLAAGGPPLLGLAHGDTPAVAGVVAIYVDVADVEAAFDRCSAAGATITMPLTTHPWQMRDFVLLDPDGHQVAVGQRLGPA